MRNIYFLLRINVLAILLVAVTCTAAKAQVLWGMTSTGGSKVMGGNIFSLHTDGTGFTERYAFLVDGSSPQGQRLLDYGDGYLYGVVSVQNTNLATGILYKMLPDGSNYQVLYYFPTGTPSSGVVKGADGYLYGTTTLSAGNSSNGSIYKIRNTGTGFQALHYFTGTDGSYPNSELVLSGGIFYATTSYGGLFNKGVLYSIHPDGTVYTIVHHFDGNSGSAPTGPLSVSTGRGGTFFYGTTNTGGSNNLGVLYQLNLTGSAYQVLYNFYNGMGSPTGSLLRMPNGLLYGTTKNTIYNGGTIYSYNVSNGSISILNTFAYDLYNVYVQKPNGILLNINNVIYGSTEQGGASHDGTVFKMNPDGTGFLTLHQQTDANGAYGSLSYINNQLYGLTQGGSANQVPTFSAGTIYKLNTDGTGFLQLHSFNNTNGYAPCGSLIHATDGSLYGLTSYGGSGYSNGLLFSIKTDGTAFNPLQWTDNGPAAGLPLGSPLQASDGSFYGMNKYSGPSWTGSIFKLTVTPTQQFQQFDPFCHAPGCAEYPVGSLLQASDGWLYGMTPISGQTGTQGTVFKTKTDGTGYVVLHTFGGVDGGSPFGYLIQAPDGYLYGMTENGGTNNMGIIFKMKTDGTIFQTVFQFGSSSAGIYGFEPEGSLLRGTDGKLYGTTLRGGTSAGVVFRVNTDGTGYQVITNFTGINGSFPIGSLIQDAATGTLYGMTNGGGTYGYGTVFKLNPDGTGFVKLLDFNGANGKLPKGDLLLLPAGSPLKLVNPALISESKMAVDNSASVEIAPNPVHNSFNIRFKNPLQGKLSYTLSDMNGKLIRQYTSPSAAAAFSQTVDMAGLPAGIYVLKAVAGTREFIQKIVKQ